jgi:hypothetical protein
MKTFKFPTGDPVLDRELMRRIQADDARRINRQGMVLLIVTAAFMAALIFGMANMIFQFSLN